MSTSLCWAKPQLQLFVTAGCTAVSHSPHPPSSEGRGEPCWSSCLALRTTTYRLVQPHLPSEEEGRGTQLVIMSCPEVSHSPHLPSSEGGGLLVIMSCPEDSHIPSRTAPTYPPQRRVGALLVIMSCPEGSHIPERLPASCSLSDLWSQRPERSRNPKGMATN